MMKMGLPQVLVIFYMTLVLGINLAKHGETYPRKMDAGFYFVNRLLELAVLYWGGFFG
jgi:hypothetical protein